ncbi:MAG: uncharacterized protein QG670_612 [Thermoproteota archaeon]|nr:uncharacterized protein [Thermoproteota archaeon]
MRRWSLFLKIGEDYLGATLRQPDKEVKDAILYLHGWGGNRETQSSLLDQICETGFYVLSFSQRGFDDSTGRRCLANWSLDTSYLADYLIEKGLNVWICGLSTGGTMAISAMVINERIIGGIIISPFASLDQLFKDKPERRNRLQRIFSPFAEEDFRAADAFSKVSLVYPRRLLFICGDADDVIPFTHSKLLSEKGGDNSTLVIIPKADHTISTITSSELSKMITEWISQSFSDHRLS